jgi:hypothetical protein
MGRRFVVCVMLVACGGDDTSDGGMDATVDGPGLDSSVDATVDSGNDATALAAADAADAPADTSSDGTIEDASDAGSETDASDAGATDASDGGGDAGLDDAGCGSKTSFAFSSDAGCGIGVDYTCGTSTYEIECKCSPGICTCKKNDAGTGGLFNYGGCPACSSTPSYTTLATGCGIPY